eukprot:Tamp_07183.p2 GENE.Tamp_07183~~Tamp_07183.p2  ORF type:complete len:338 (-),score=64.87 Tamp_07183:1540-2514(-)
MADPARIDLSRPRYDQSTYWGRARHFFEVTDPRTILCSDAELDGAKLLLDQYRAGKEPSGTTEEQIWRAKVIYESAFHPQTGEKNFFLGRMSCQVPANMLITSAMMTWYKSNTAAVILQWVNQTFNATTNYTNRNASSPVTTEMLAQAYVIATICSVTVAVGLNKAIARSATLSRGIIGRFVPLTAIAAANCINIPMMRQVELKEGIAVATAEGVEVGTSKAAALSAVAQVVPSRVIMAVPNMGFTPIIMAGLEKRGLFTAYPFLNMPVTTLVTGIMLVVSTPLCCAIFPQQAEIKIENLEPELRAKVKELIPGASVLYYNKGL